MQLTVDTGRFPSSLPPSPEHASTVYLSNIIARMDQPTTEHGDSCLLASGAGAVVALRLLSCYPLTWVHLAPEAQQGTGSLPTDMTPSFEQDMSSKMGTESKDGSGPPVAVIARHAHLDVSSLV